MEIITTTQIMTNYFADFLFIIAFFAFFIGIIPEFILDIEDYFLIAILVAFIASIVINWLAPIDYTGKNKYLVKINDSVSFNEVINKYEIVDIDEENGLVTLKDKEPINNAE